MESVLAEDQWQCKQLCTVFVDCECHGAHEHEAYRQRACSQPINRLNIENEIEHSDAPSAGPHTRPRSCMVTPSYFCAASAVSSKPCTTSLTYCTVGVGGKRGRRRCRIDYSMPISRGAVVNNECNIGGINFGKVSGFPRASRYARTYRNVTGITGTYLVPPSSSVLVSA